MKPVNTKILIMSILLLMLVTAGHTFQHRLFTADDYERVWILKKDTIVFQNRNLSMKMRHLRQQFSVAPVRYLATPVC